METVIDWSKAPEGATHYYKNSPQPWRDLSGCIWKYFSHGEWLTASSACKSEWLLRELGTVLLARPSPQTWTGEGLPPVGLEVEIGHGDDWTRCKIIAHALKEGVPMAVFTYAQSFSGETDVNWCVAQGFRPLRTPEQIAADERKSAKKAIQEVIERNFDISGITASGISGAIADAGYRKQVEP